MFYTNYHHSHLDIKHKLTLNTNYVMYKVNSIVFYLLILF